jgi:hypothetical protein
VEGKTDFDGGTTAVVVWVKRRVTPKVLWSAIGVLVAALMASITWIVTTQSDIHQLKESVAESKRSVADMRQQLDLLHQIDTRLAVMNSKMDDIADEVDRQRGEWDHVHGIAESPPHARRRSK